MTRTVALLACAESGLAAEVARGLDARGVAAAILDLEAPLDGKPVTIRGRGCVWQGCDLAGQDAVWLERPLFPWPQALLPRRPVESPDDFGRWLRFQREARALAVSAIAVAAGSTRVANPPAAAHLAVSPALALDDVAAAGLPVQAWHIGPADDPAGIDAVGTDLWHRPGTLPAGASRLAWDGYDAPGRDVLMVFGEPAGALDWPDAAAWRAGRREPATATVADPPGAAVDLARRAVAALGLDIAAVSVTGDDPVRILVIDAAPDLAAWNGRLTGRVGAALVRGLAEQASASEGDRP